MGDVARRAATPTPPTNPSSDPPASLSSRASGWPSSSRSPGSPISFGSALTNPSYGTSLSSRAAEWGRDHGLGGLVNAIESEWYKLHPPKVGGKPPPGSFTGPTTVKVPKVAAAPRDAGAASIPGGCVASRRRGVASGGPARRRHAGDLHHHRPSRRRCTRATSSASRGWTHDCSARSCTRGQGSPEAAPSRTPHRSRRPRLARSMPPSTPDSGWMTPTGATTRTVGRCCRFAKVPRRSSCTPTGPSPSAPGEDSSP